MLLLYNLGIRLYYLAIRLAAFFNPKAKQWISGRRGQHIKNFEKSIWFHFASLGEFEQGRPVLEEMKARHADTPVVITFFSPSGYEIRKNTPLADAVYYLPLDTAHNARRFIGTINPVMAVFTKYEYWYHFFNALHRKQVPLYMISGIFRPGQVFFKWYGSLHRRMLGMVSHFFVQDELSAGLLKSLGITHITVSGDTRFDRVWANAQNPKELPQIEAFKNGSHLLVAGSTWPEDEHLLVQLVTAYPDWKFIFAPHEINEEKINNLMDLLPAAHTKRFSQITEGPNQVNECRVLIIDNIGMLSSLYQYGEAAYIGGGFGAGIHNTLEAAAFGLPVIFGPNYHKFKEARDIIELKAGISVSNQHELDEAARLFLRDAEYRRFASEKIKNYVEVNIGATNKIISLIA